MKDFIVRINNGYHFEYHSTIQAASVKKAREQFLKEHAGAWYATPQGIKVSQIKTQQQN